MNRDLRPFLRRIISLTVAGSAAAVHAETLTSPDANLVAVAATPFAAARAPLTPQDVLASTSGAASRPRQFMMPRPSAQSRQLPQQGPLIIGGTTSATPIDPQAIGNRSESFRMEALLRDAAIKSVEPTAKFIWIQ
jgi:hypothetical protein